MADTSSLNDLLPRFLRRCDADSTRLAYERELQPVPAVAARSAHHRSALRLSGPSARPKARADHDLVAHDGGPGVPEVCGGSGRGWGSPSRGLQAAQGDDRASCRTFSAAASSTRYWRPPTNAPTAASATPSSWRLWAVGGLRAGEVCRLDRSDIQIRSGTVVLIVSGKGRKQRLVPLSGPWAGPVRSYMGTWAERGVEHEPAFWCGQPGHEDRRLTVAAVDYLVRIPCGHRGPR